MRFVTSLIAFVFVASTSYAATVNLDFEYEITSASFTNNQPNADLIGEVVRFQAALNIDTLNHGRPTNMRADATVTFGIFGSFTQDVGVQFRVDTAQDGSQSAALRFGGLRVPTHLFPANFAALPDQHLRSSALMIISPRVALADVGYDLANWHQFEATTQGTQSTLRVNYRPTVAGGARDNDIFYTLTATDTEVEVAQQPPIVPVPAGGLLIITALAGLCVAATRRKAVA